MSDSKISLLIFGGFCGAALLMLGWLTMRAARNIDAIKDSAVAGGTPEGVPCAEC